MILPFEPYNSQWKEMFGEIKCQLEESLQSIQPRVEHIGSTAVEGLSAKPIIDIMIGVKDDLELNQVPLLLAGKQYVYYPKYNVEMPYRRFFVLLKDSPKEFGLPETIDIGEEIPEKMHNHDLRIAHIHVIPVTSENWTRHIAFRDYLRTFSAVKDEYQALKEKLVQQQWEDGNDYNAGKDEFLKREEKQAIAWYSKQKENEI
ncbi:GrpB family protein [Myroides odoratus]|uniref:GrpB family protein n=1 Tax=Myroides odoratus TaxID=256 RepID=UPI0039B10B28